MSSLVDAIKELVNKDAKISYYYTYTEGYHSRMSSYFKDIRVKSTGSDACIECLPFDNFPLHCLSGKETTTDLFQLGLKLGKCRSQQLEEVEKRSQVFSYCYSHRNFRNFSAADEHDGGGSRVPMPKYKWMAILSESRGGGDKREQPTCCVLGNDASHDGECYAVHLGSRDCEKIKNAFDSCPKRYSLNYPQIDSRACVSGAGGQFTMY